jgi:hypothetical protein
MNNNHKVTEKNGEAPGGKGTMADSKPDAANPHHGETLVNSRVRGVRIEDLSPFERVTAIQMQYFVHTPITAMVIKKMEELLKFPKQDRMPCILILGDSNSGKTSVLKKFWRSHPAVRHPADYQDRRPVIYFEVSGPGESRFFDQALKGLGVTPALSHNPRQKEQQFLTHCTKQGVRALVIDEFHNGIHTSSREQLKLLVRVKSVTNMLQIPLIVAGTPDAKTFLFSDPQLSSRFVIQERIPRWQDGKEYRGFLHGLEIKYPLKKPSMLGEIGVLAVKIMDMTEGLTGEMVRLLQASAVLAIETAEEQITEKLLDSVIWTKPSERHLEPPAPN